MITQEVAVAASSNKVQSGNAKVPSVCRTRQQSPRAERVGADGVGKGLKKLELLADPGAAGGKLPDCSNGRASRQ